MIRFAEIGADDEAEQQVARQARQAEAAEQVAGHRRQNEREPDREGGAPRIRFHRADLPDPHNRGDDERDGERAPHGRASRGWTKCEITAEPSDPATATARTIPARSGPAAWIALRPNAIASTPGDTR